MALPRILVLVLAGGAGGRLELLTENRAKPAVPFAGVYRLADRLGLDHERLTYKFQGRHYRLTDVHGQVIKELIS